MYLDVECGGRVNGQRRVLHMRVGRRQASIHAARHSAVVRAHAHGVCSGVRRWVHCGSGHTRRRELLWTLVSCCATTTRRTRVVVKALAIALPTLVRTLREVDVWSESAASNCALETH